MLLSCLSFTYTSFYILLYVTFLVFFFFFSSRRRHTRYWRDWSSDVCSSDLLTERVREMFKGEIPDDWKLTVSAVNFDRKDIDSITPEWIKRRMERLKLKNKDRKSVV